MISDSIPALRELTCIASMEGELVSYVPAATVATLIERLKTIVDQLELLAQYSESRCVCADLRAVANDFMTALESEWGCSNR